MARLKLRSPVQPKPQPPQVYNHSGIPTEDVTKLQLIGCTVNKWRGRNIALYQHPTEADKVVSHGTTFDKKMIVIAVDNKSDWKTALDYIAHGKVYTSE